MCAEAVYSPPAPLARSPIPASCATIGQILRQSHRAPALPPARRPPRQESAAAMPIPAALLITIPTISISMPALAHAGGGAAEDLGNIWLAWNFDPLLALGTAAFVALYFYALGPLRRRYGWAESVDRGQVALFLVGTAVWAFALMSPLDALGDDYLFSAHMVQHMLIAVVAPPLWLLGTPEWMLAPLFRRRGVLAVARFFTNPIVAFALFNGDLWLWHL